ncbi:Hypothetical predicted protein [Lynx pardinus]|uniref:Uncharacterized protein n=1 Tax=Lynx pardinus TaxID=191816 RepID=A0A485NE80_LYNPA|nr:Hypothetical predicted protein [Lynx pardinus]
MCGSGENGVTQLSVSSMETLFSLISNRAPVLCLQLLSTTRFFTVCDQAPGSTSLPSFVSNETNEPLNSEGLRLRPVPPLCGRVSLGNGQTLPHPGKFAKPCCCRSPETVARCEPPQKKFTS